MKEETKDLDLKKLVKKRTKIFIITGSIMFLVYTLHLYLSYQSFYFITGLFEGDIIVISRTVLTAFTVTGWIILFRLVRKIP